MAKKTFFKKTLAFALAVILTVGAGPLAGLCGLELPSISSFVASAAEEEPVWTIATDDMLVIEGNTITGYTDKLSGNIEIPTNTSNGTAITTIASGAFENCSDLTAVKIPETIISIGWYAFKNTGLETVYFHATACEMGSNANEGYSTFTDNANLTKFVFGENVSKIPANACASAKNLQKVEFEGTVTEIGENAFFNCPSLSAIDLSNVKTIGESAFKDCTTLKVTDKNTSTADDKGTIVFSDNLLIIYDYAFENCTSIKEVTIPEKVTYVGWKAFKNTGLETVYFHATACEMGSNANEGYSTFTDNANLTKFVFGENVTKIPANACASAKNLQKVEFEGTVTEIGENAFFNCPSLSAIDLSNVKTIGESAFKDCTTLKVTDKNTSTADDKGTIVFSDNLLTIYDYAFENCTSIKEVTIPEKVTYVGWKAFKNTGLETVYFHATACEMGSNANEGYSTFTDNANLTKFVFGENVSKIPANACASAKNLQKVEFEGTVTEIGENAFFNCPSLSAIDLSNVKTIGESAFKDCTTLKVTDKNTSTADDKGTIVFSDNLLTIYDYAFENCTSIKEVTIPEKVTYVGWKAFKNTGLETVYFHATACEMGSNANEGYSTFTDNANLTKFVFGENVTKIPVNACASATNICEIVINGLTTTIEKNAFYNCTSLSDVYYNAGSKEDWNSITINSGNDILSSADVTIHFGIKPEEKRNEKFDVTASYISNAFTEEVDIAVTEVDGTHENGSVNILDNEIREMVGCFNIKMVSVETGKAVQPVNGKTVTITMPIPQQYLGKKNFRIIHELENGARENFATNAPNSKNRIEITSDGKYLKFNVSSFSKFEVMTFELLPAVSIKNNTGSKTISYGETLRLTANTSNMPADAKIFWYVDGVKKGEGTTFEVSPESGSVEVTVKVVDVNGNDYADTDISDTEKVTVKSGFFQKLISFFKNLFRISRVVTQAFSVK